MIRRTFVAVVLVLSSATTWAAHAAPNPVAPSLTPPGTSFASSTDGLPVGSVVGLWTVCGTDAAGLVFAGGHAAGSKTTFTGRWTTPFSKKARRHSIGYWFSFETLATTATIRGVVKLRQRAERGVWSPWSTQALSFKPGSGGMGAGSLRWSFTPRARRLQYDWKVEGTLVGPGELDGDATIKVDGNELVQGACGPVPTP